MCPVVSNQKIAGLGKTEQRTRKFFNIYRFSYIWLYFLITCWCTYSWYIPKRMILFPPLKPFVYEFMLINRQQGRRSNLFSMKATKVLRLIAWEFAASKDVPIKFGHLLGARLDWVTWWTLFLINKALRSERRKRKEWKLCSMRQINISILLLFIAEYFLENIITHLQSPLTFP